MPKFRYQAVDEEGTYHRGTIDSPSFQAAMDEIKGKGLWIVDLFDQSKSLLYREITFGGPKVKLDEFTVFCRQLATLFKAGIHLVEGIRILSEQTPSKPFRKILTDMAEDMKGGIQLSAASAKYPTVFSTVFVNMVRAGEASGNLDEMLHRLAVFYEKEYYTRQKVQSAMIYPAVMGVMAFVVVTLMMIFVIPKYIANFQAMGLELPWPTRVVIHISEFVQAYWPFVIASAFAPKVIAILLKRSKKAMYYMDYYKLKIPVFGKLWQKQALARFSRTFSSLFAAAIPMLQILPIVATVVGNEAIQKLILDSRDSVRGGQSIADPYRESPLFPPMVVQMLAIGERTGALDGMLEKVADFYEADVDATADRLKALLEPLMIVAMAGIVGGIVAAVMLPTFKLMSNFGA